MKKIFFVLMFQLLANFLIAQTIIKGKIVDQQTNEPISLVDISLYNSLENEFLEAYYSDDSGNFTLILPDSKLIYKLDIEAFGYETQTLTINNQDSIIIKLKPNSTYVLNEVTVIAKKKAITMNGDKIIYDVEQMGISAANNGLETLQQLPGVSLDKDENVKFRGSTGIQVMINGKKSMLQGDALREFIRSLKSDDIKSIEIISQPSARYEATGTTGILNIVLKKNITQMIGGNLNTFGSYGEYFKHQTGGRFFYNDESWSVNASGSYYEGKSFNDRAVNQVIETANGQRKLDQTNYWLPSNVRKSFNLGIERKLNKNQLISTEWQYFSDRENAETTGKTNDFLNGDLQKEVKLLSKNRTPTDQLSGNLFYNFTSDSLTTKIDVQLNYSRYKKSINGYQRNEYIDQTFDQLNGSNQTKYDLMNAQIDLNQKLSDKLSLEAGAKFSYVEMNYFNHYSAVDGSEFFISDSLMVNDFLYKEKITSAYSQFNYNLEKWNFLAGLRMENYQYDAISKINQQKNQDNYTNWFPSASINYQNKNHQYRLSYSKRIARPNYLTLNPYVQYIDAYTLDRGNPNLKPQFYDSFELNYIYKSKLSFGLYGYLYQDGFVNVIDYQTTENYNILYESNASKGSRFGFTASIPFEVGKFWTMQFGLDAYLETEKSNIQNYAYDGTGAGYEINTYHRFTLPDSWVISLNGFLTGRNNTPTGYNPMVYDFSGSIKKSLLKDKIQVVAGCNNILKKSMWNSHSTVNNVQTHWVNKWETRRFYLQLTYNFGSNKEKKVKNTSLSDEQNRM